MPHSLSKIDMHSHNAIIISYYSVIKDASCLCSRSYNILESVLSGFTKAKKLGVFEDEDKLLEIKQYSLNLYADFKAIKERNFNATSSIVVLEKDISFELQTAQNTIKGLSGGIMQLTNRNKYSKMKVLLHDLERLFQHMSFLLLELDRMDKAVEGVMDDILEYTSLTENSTRYSESKGDRVKIIADKMLLGTQTLQHHLKHMEAGVNKTALQFRHNFFHILLA